MASIVSHSVWREGVPPSHHPGDLRLAAIDIGSNSIHMVIAQADADGSITTLWDMKEMVGLGRISFPAHRLTREAMDRAIVALQHFTQHAQRRHCVKTIAIATSAVRESDNGGDFIERVRREVGLNVRVISARDEARLIYLGVRHAIDLAGGSHLIVDVGGGSVEFIVADGTRPLLLESRKLGAARLTARCVKSDPISEDDLRCLQRQYDRELTDLCATIANLKPIRAIGTSGTVENLAAMCGTTDRDNGQAIQGTLERDALEKLVKQLIKSDSGDRAKIRGLDEKRQDQVVAGALLMQELFTRLDLKRMDVCRSALREGMLLDYLARHQPDLAIRRQVPDPRRRSVLDLARRCDWHQTHSLHVVHLVLRLFDQLKPLHGLGPRARQLIEYGTILHDIGWHIGHKGHHKHAMYLILNGQLQGFSRREIQIIACIARYHRKATPKLKHAVYRDLPPKARAVVDVGTALLRLADGLDRSHCGVVTDVRCRIGPDHVRMTLKPRGDAQLELWAARRRMGYFRDIFGRQIEFHDEQQQTAAAP